MFGCLISQTGFQNDREAQGAFYNFAKVLCFSEKTAAVQMAGRNFLAIHAPLWRFPLFSDMDQAGFNPLSQDIASPDIHGVE
jgi:hypothetical protein